MKTSTIIIVLLVVALVTTNAWWAFHVLDSGVSYTHQSAELEQNQQALKQTLAIIAVLGDRNASRAQIVQSAKDAWGDYEAFEKEGYLWVGRLGLRFNESGRLVEAVAGF